MTAKMYLESNRSNTKRRHTNLCLLVASLLFILCTSLIATTHAATAVSANPKTLVVLDNNLVKTTHSMFFNDLQYAGHKLDFINILEEPLVLSLHGKWLYENLIIFAPTLQDLGEFVKPKDIMAFVDAGNSLLLAGDGRMSEPLREIALYYGVDFDEETSKLVDVSEKNVSPKKSSLAGSAIANILAETAHGSVGREITSQGASIFTVDVSCSDPRTPTAILSKVCPTSQKQTYSSGTQNKKHKLYYSGIGSLVVENSQFVRAVVSGNPTTLSIDLGTSSSSITPVSVSSSAPVLISASQSLINARAVFSGSLAMFSDAFYQLPGSSNRDITSSIARWTFHQTGFIRVRKVSHKLADEESGSLPQHGYKVGDEIVYSVDLEEYNDSTKQWEPYQDYPVLFEMVMVDAFYRYPFTKSTKVRLPDTFGNYKVRTKVDRFHSTGEAYIEHDTIVPVRPYRQEEYDRFVLVASPYYVNAFSIMSAFVIFCYAFLYTK